MGWRPLRLIIAAWLWGVKNVPVTPKRSVLILLSEEPQMPDESPLGLTEAEENDFRVLLTKIREHDPMYLSKLVMLCAVQTQPPETVKTYTSFDEDQVLTHCVVVAKGTGQAAHLIRDLGEMMGDG